MDVEGLVYVGVGHVNILVSMTWDAYYAMMRTAILSYTKMRIMFHFYILYAMCLFSKFGCTVGGNVAHGLNAVLTQGPNILQEKS